jgi:hypothetical protein
MLSDLLDKAGYFVATAGINGGPGIDDQSHVRIQDVKNQLKGHDFASMGMRPWILLASHKVRAIHPKENIRDLPFQRDSLHGKLA